MKKKRLNSEQLNEQDLRSLKRTNILLAFFALLSFLLMIVALLLQVRSERNLRMAQADKIEARYKEVKAVTELNLTSKALTEAEIEAEKAVEKVEEAGKKVNEEVKKRAVTEKKLLKTEEVLLSSQQSEEQARKLSAETLRLRMLALGKSMAVRSLYIEGDKDLQTLLAYQAYKFNRSNGGSAIDNDIYTGLYSAVRNYGNRGRKDYQWYRLRFLKHCICAGYTGVLYFIIRWKDTKVGFKWFGDRL